MSIKEKLKSIQFLLFWFVKLYIYIFIKFNILFTKWFIITLNYGKISTNKHYFKGAVKMENKIRVGIVGYGNLGKGVRKAINQNPDMELEAIFTRREVSKV